MRLTEKDKMARYGYKYVAPDRFDNFGKGCNKLGQLEDIEENLGIDLIVYLRMTLGTKVSVKNKSYEGMFENGVMEQIFLKYLYNYERKCFCLNFYGSLTPIYYIEDYGKTWALTKEELL